MKVCADQGFLVLCGPCLDCNKSPMNESFLWFYNRFELNTLLSVFSLAFDFLSFSRGTKSSPAPSCLQTGFCSKASTVYSRPHLGQYMVKVSCDMFLFMD